MYDKLKNSTRAQTTKTERMNSVLYFFVEGKKKGELWFKKVFHDGFNFPLYLRG